jgi:alanine dehydrogenase
VISERLPFIAADEVARLLPYGMLVDALEAAHREPRALTGRTVLGVDGGEESFLALTAWQPARGIGTKLVTVFPGNLGQGRPSVQALYVLFDPTTGDPSALIDGTELTYRKTAADSALGARHLAREDVRTLLMIGAGGLAPHLVAAHRAVRPSIDDVLVWNRTPSRAAALAAAIGGRVADRIEDAAATADVIVTATMTKEPLVAGRWLRPGTHLDLVGAFRPDHREVDDDAVLRAAVYVDDREATLRESGDLVIPMSRGLITSADIRADLFELCRGDVVGRDDPATITLFENGGGGHLDLMTATVLWERARHVRR